MFGVTIEEDYCAVINLLLLRGRKKSFLQVVCMYDVPGRERTERRSRLRRWVF